MIISRNDFYQTLITLFMSNIKISLSYEIIMIVAEKVAN